ncbi:signal peptidase I [Winogradskyella echinorum]|uniref:Signal peptidase I n=1 Tax=Winogradskyella echinorum TaxID=538189 RepID=A0ABR6Y2K3_9FLAO|nr:signal peptidase I [Winogradskyella echinorum]MBC3846904.1 signal peptidase I [Winogradskyella echinorum]MBC5751252.1 signal peptidase I [Winogradskyella echinorum]
MTWTEWFIFLLIIQIIHGLGTWKLYVKAGRKAWEAFVPVYNAVILMKIISRPWWWVILMFLPIVNLIMIPAAWVETARAFGKDSKLDALLCIVTLGFYLYYLNYATDVSYIENRRLAPKTSTGEWITSILFAIVAATIVHTYFFQPFVIPSSSLEKSLLVGDFLIVSKIHYGARTPMTTIGAPMVHDTIPKLGMKSYLYNDNFEERETSWKNKLQLPYFRLPGFEKIERNDIIVFNQPADTLLNMNDFHPNRNYYKPIDKKTNLVKRCVGIPGDTLEVRNGIVYINGIQNKLPDRTKLQFSHDIVFKNVRANTFDELNQMAKLYLKKYDITDNLGYNNVTKNYTIQATPEAAKKAVVHPNIESITYVPTEKGLRDNSVFPHDYNYNWNANYFGPIWIPKAGATVELNTENIALYKRAISEYEGHKVVTRGNQVFIDDQPATAYTFGQDYYWAMGDNRHNSIDSRFWGFVPYNHIFGKPVFIWMSIDGINSGLKNWRPRWDRIFTTVSGSGERTSYLIPFIVLIFGITFFNKWRKKKKAKA